jgi:hypothetical protein
MAFFNSSVSQTLMDSLEKQADRGKMIMRFGTRSVKTSNRAASLEIKSKKLSNYNLDLMHLQEARWDVGGTELAGEYIFLYRRGNENHEMNTGYFVHKIITSVFKRVVFASDRMP